jgi:nucleotide-binding universal stress UspA family protein
MTEDNRPIVVGIVESEAAQRALGWAIDEAIVRHCSVHAVTVWTAAPARRFPLDARR